MNIYVMERQLLIDEIKKGFVLGNKFFERDVLAPQTEKLNIQGYEFTGYQARIDDMKSYFDENMKLLKDENLDSLFSGNPDLYQSPRRQSDPLYQRIKKRKNVMVADGCVIEGEIENSILFRGVKVAKGAKVKNCILMQDTVIEAGAEIEYVVSDKYVTVSEGKHSKEPTPSRYLLRRIRLYKEKNRMKYGIPTANVEYINIDGQSVFFGKIQRKIVD